MLYLSPSVRMNKIALQLRQRTGFFLKSDHLRSHICFCWRCVDPQLLILVPTVDSNSQDCKLQIKSLLEPGTVPSPPNVGALVACGSAWLFFLL